jgi:hypothetical protein
LKWPQWRWRKINSARTVWLTAVAALPIFRLALPRRKSRTISQIVSCERRTWALGVTLVRCGDVAAPFRLTKPKKATYVIAIGTGSAASTVASRCRESWDFVVREERAAMALLEGIRCFY